MHFVCILATTFGAGIYCFHYDGIKSTLWKIFSLFPASVAMNLLQNLQQLRATTFFRANRADHNFAKVRNSLDCIFFVFFSGENALLRRNFANSLFNFAFFLNYAY